MSELTKTIIILTRIISEKDEEIQSLKNDLVEMNNLSKELYREDNDEIEKLKEIISDYRKAYFELEERNKKLVQDNSALVKDLQNQ